MELENQTKENSSKSEDNTPSSKKDQKGKSLKEYLLDGLMIFLAVVLGFIAENIREDISEANRTKVFASSMIDDLKSDTTELKSRINYLTYATANIDSLMHLFLTKNVKEIPSGKLYWYGLWGGARLSYVPNDATFEQMKSSGSLRYITNNSLLKKIVDYNQLGRLATIGQERDNYIYSEVRKIRGQIFDFRYNMEANDIYQANRETPDIQKIDTFLNSKPPLLTDDNVIFNQYLELVRSRNLYSRLREAENLLNHANVLIDELKKEYRINSK